MTHNIIVCCHYFYMCIIIHAVLLYGYDWQCSRFVDIASPQTCESSGKLCGDTKATISSGDGNS